MSKKKKSFRSTWQTLTEIGQQFGISAVKTGKLLKEFELRLDSGEPAQIAVDDDLCHIVETNGQKPYWLWHGGKIGKIFEQKGIQRSAVSAKEARKTTEARKLARSWMEAQAMLDQGDDKVGFMLADSIMEEIPAVGVDRFNSQLKALGWKGNPVLIESGGIQGE